MYCYGVDVGGTTVKLGLFTTEGILIEKWEIKTNTSYNGENILLDVAKAIEINIKKNKFQKREIIGIGLGVPGPVDEQGIVYKCVNLGWDIFNVSKELELLTGYTVKVANDANVAALGEMWKGGGEGYKDVIMFTLGTGVGGGVIINSKIITGKKGAAGELGHMPIILENGELCGCGKKGCLETVASATGIVREAKKYLQKTEEFSSLRTLDNITAKAIFDAAKEGDAISLILVEQLGKYLGLAAAYVSNVLDPEVFVIGGGVSKAGDILINVITKYYQMYAFQAHNVAKFKIAKLGNDAGIIGAAKLVLNVNTL